MWFELLDKLDYVVMALAFWWVVHQVVSAFLRQR